VYLIIIAEHGEPGCYLNEQLLTVSRYLYPFVLEYSLIAIGAICCIISTGIEPSLHSIDGSKQVARGFKNLIRVVKHSFNTQLATGIYTTS
jgi:hypothetical protein